MSIRDIYGVIADTPIGDVVARNLEDIKLQVRASDCPVRMLLPSTQGTGGFIAIGTMSRTTWLIRDLCLWQPLIEGSGIEQCSNDMLAYIELYATAIRALRNPTPESSILSVGFQLGPVLWGTTDFWAVDVTLEVEEFLA